MPYLQKPYYNKIILFWLLFVSFLVMRFPMTSYAASDSVSVQLSVNQIFTKNTSALGVNHIFFYQFTPLEVGNPMPPGSNNSTYTFTIGGTSQKDFSPITFFDTGLYQYQIKADLSDTSAGYVYDDEIYIVSVYVKRSGSDLIADCLIMRKSSGKKVSAVLFEHSYTPHPSNPRLMVDPPVKKTVSGAPPKSSVFVFTLMPKDPANPMPSGSINGVKTVTITGSGEKEFGTWQYTREGTYYYTISELNTGESKYIYDTAVYTITDMVKDVNGQLTVNRVVTNRSNKPVSACIFINKYKGGSGGGGTGGSADTGFITIQKRSGDGERAGFTFVVTGGRNYMDEYVTDENGLIQIKNLPKGRYTIREKETKRMIGRYKLPNAQTVSVFSGGVTVSFYNALLDEIPIEGSPLHPQNPISPENGGQIDDNNPPVSIGLDGPKTGDNASNELYIAMMIAGIAAAAICIRYLLFHHKRENSES